MAVADARRTIDVAFTPAEVRPAQVAVVLDVLRATTTIVAALECGFRRVLCADSIERAHRLRASDRVLAGERGCLAPPGFDLGNSPAALPPGHGRDLVLATTNGAPAVVAAARQAERVLIGALVNLGAVAGAIGPGNVQIVCAGTGGRPAVEDVYAAGLLSAALSGERTDAALIAERTAAGFTEPMAALAASANAAVLRQVGLAADVAWCAQVAVSTTVPRVAATVDGVAFIEETPGESTDISLELFESVDVGSPA